MRVSIALALIVLLIVLYSFRSGSAGADSTASNLPPDPNPDTGGDAVKPVTSTHKELAYKWAKVYALSPNMVLAIMRVESNFNDKAVSKPNSNGTTDYGLMQINSANLEWLGLTTATAMNADLNTKAGCRVLATASAYLRDHSKFSDVNLISAYNAGPGHVVSSGITNLGYVAKVSYWTLLYNTLYPEGRL